jgi:radical SAM protein with 4Fe4S-binding SPASM domain
LARPRIRTLVVEVTRRCDHACVHCYNFWRRPDRPLHEPVGVLRALLARVLDQVVCSDVTLSGGEPLLYTDLDGLIADLEDRRVRVTLVTNGRQLDRQRAAILVDGGVALFELPLLSHRRQLHDRLSGAPGSFDAAVAALTTLRTLGASAVAVFVATRENLADIRGTLELAFALGARGVMVNRYNAGPQTPDQVRRLMPRPGELARALRIADRVGGELGLPVSCSIPVMPCLVDLGEFTHLRFGFCAAGTAAAYPTLDASGDVRPCNHSPTVLGNGWREPMAAILDPARSAAFDGPVPEFCALCAERERCRGGCRAAAQVCYGGVDLEEPFLALHRAQARPPSRTGN